MLTRKTDTAIHQWVFDPAREFALLKYRLEYPKRPGSSLEFVGQDFKKVDGLMLPMKVTITNIVKIGTEDPYESRKTEISVSSYRVNNPENMPDLYKMVWPLNSIVRDNRTGVTIRVTSRPRVIDDSDFISRP